MTAWDHKQCKCKICATKELKAGEEVEVFDSISAGKTHIFIFHRIPYAKARDYLTITSEVRERIIRIGID